MFKVGFGVLGEGVSQNVQGVARLGGIGQKRDEDWSTSENQVD